MYKNFNTAILIGKKQVNIYIFSKEAYEWCACVL